MLYTSRVRSQEYESEDKKQVADDLVPGLVDVKDMPESEEEEQILAERDDSNKPIVHDEM